MWCFFTFSLPDSEENHLHCVCTRLRLLKFNFSSRHQTWEKKESLLLELLESLSYPAWLNRDNARLRVPSEKLQQSMNCHGLRNSGGMRWPCGVSSSTGIWNTRFAYFQHGEAMLRINCVRFTDQILLNTAVVGDGDAAICCESHSAGNNKQRKRQDEAKKQLFSGHPTGHDPLFDWTKQTGHEHSKKAPRIVVIFPSSTESTIIKGGNQDKYSIYL